MGGWVWAPGPPPTTRCAPRLDASENQVDETIFVLESFIASTLRKP